MSFQRNNLVTISDGNEATHESTIKKLGSYSKEKIMKMLREIQDGGPGFAESLNVGDAIAQKAMHQDPEIAAAAVACLGILGHRGGKYEPLLVQLMNHPVVAVRAAVVETFGHLGAYLKDTSAVAGATADAEPLVRVTACQAIAEMEATQCHEAVAKLLEDAVPEVQCAAIQAIGSFIAVSLEMESVYASKVGGALEKMLAGGRTRSAALDAIYEMGEKAPSSCVAATLAALADKDYGTRQSAVAAVGSMAGAVLAAKGSLPKLEELLKDESVGAKTAAANALAALGEKAAASAEAVAELLSSEEEDASYLALVMGNGARRPPPQMRRPKCAAITALGRMGVESQLAKISEALNDAQWEVRLCAAEALGALGEKAKGEASALMGSMEDDAFPVRAMVCYALGQLGDTEAAPRLVEAFEDSAFTVRLYAVQALGEMGEAAEEHCHEVFKLTNDPVADVKAAAVKVLAKMGSNSEHYAGVIASMAVDEDAGVRASVCEALGGLGEAGAACREEVEELLGDPSPFVRSAATAALENMGYATSPFLKDFGKGPGVPNDAVPYWRSKEEKPAGVLLPGEICFEGLGLYFSDIVSKKQELMSSGKWVEGVL